jgi:sRNA-binding protein
MGELKKWRDQNWVRIDSSGNIAGECGTSKNKKNPDRCLPRSKAESLSKSERKSTARKKKKAGAKGKTVVSNTKKAKVKKANGGMVRVF